LTDFGHDASGSNDTVTIGSDGTGTETDSSSSTSSDKYNLNLSGSTADGHGFTYSDVGKDSSNVSDSGGNGSDGTSSDTPSEDDTATETVSLGESGGNLKASDTATDTVGYHDHVAPVSGSPGASTETVTTSDDGSKTHSYQDSGTFNGASFTVSDNSSNSDDESDTTATGTGTAGAATSGTDVLTRDGSGTDTFKLTLSGVADSPGSVPNSGSSSGPDTGSPPTGASDSLTESDTSGGSFHDTTNSTLGTGGPVITSMDDASTGNSSVSESGTFMGNPFTESDSGSYSDDATFTNSPSGLTETGETATHSTPNPSVTGTSPEAGGSQTPIGSDRAIISTTAYHGANAAGVALALTAITATPAEPAAGPDADQKNAMMLDQIAKALQNQGVIDAMRRDFQAAAKENVGKRQTEMFERGGFIMYNPDTNSYVVTHQGVNVNHREPVKTHFQPTGPKFVGKIKTEVYMDDNGNPLEGYTPIADYHTHPINSHPSPGDRTDIGKFNFPGLIIIPDGDIIAYNKKRQFNGTFGNVR